MVVSIQSFFNEFNNKIEEPVRAHLKNVYACLTLSTLAAAAGAYVDMYTTFLSNSFLTLIAAIGCLIALQTTKDNGKNTPLRLSFLVGFSFFTGIGLGPLLEVAVAIDMSIVITAFLATSLIFVSFSLSAILARRGSWLFLGGTISSLLSALLLLSLANLFLRTTAIFQISLYVGLLAMCAFVLYDTQVIIEKRRLGDRDFIAHSVDLFIDFVAIFRRILIILAQKENNKKENRKK